MRKNICKLPVLKCAIRCDSLQENLELDRATAAEEARYSTALMKLLHPELTTKTDIIVGVPEECCYSEAQASKEQLHFSWPWKKASTSSNLSHISQCG
jgi:hypothetical protein